MANKKLLKSLEFKTLDGSHTITLGGSSPDHLPKNSGNQWVDNKTRPMGQTGCVIVAQNGGTAMGAANQIVLRTTLSNLGYGSSMALYDVGVTAGVTKYYLNGRATDDDNNPMPYLMFATDGYTTRPQYYKGDDTNLGDVYTNLYYGGMNANYVVALAGEIYEDGTFAGQRVCVALPSIPSVTLKRYRYHVTADWGYDENYPVVNQNMLNDLQDYLPASPEGGGAGGGEGDFDGTSDTIGIPGLPSANPLATGMCAMYKMTDSQLQGLSDYLWSTDFGDVLEKLFNDPMEAILNLAIVPLDLTAGASATIKIGNVLTSASGYPVSYPYKQINFGTINLHEYWGSFADYSPYTKLSIFLPYVGTQQISIDDVMNGAIQLVANCDCMTGAVTYILYSAQNNWAGHSHTSVLYSWGGNMQYQIPLTASNYSQVVSSLVGTAGTIAGGVAASVATGGVTAPIAVGVIGGSIANTMNAKTHVQRGGGLGGSMGLFGVQTPYLILERPEQIYPENYAHTVGTPNESTRVLNSFSGFVKVRGVHIEIETATQNEINEIETLLKQGVIV